MRILNTFIMTLFLAVTANAAVNIPAPTSLKATALSTSQIKLTWTDNSYQENGFLIERSRSSTSGFVKVGSVGMGMRAYTDSGLAEGTLYYYRVFAYKKVNDVYYRSASSNTDLERTFAPNTVNVKDFGARADGVSDDLAAFQKAVAAVPLNGILYVPAGNYLLDIDSTTKTIQLKSNMHMKMDPNAVLKVKGNSLERSYLINISGISNVEVSGGRLMGDRNEHTGTTGEWGYGIRIGGGASNLNIHDVYIANFWGDGLCIGGYAHDIEIRRVVATNNRRQGLSITRSYNIGVYDSEFSYTNGTAPQYGIDVEPDPHPDGFYARNIRIENNYIHHNKAGGILLYKQTYDSVIRGNTISYNSYGIYTVESFNGLITGNTIAHNRYHGVSFRSGTVNFDVTGNIFRNNYTSLQGITNDTNPLTTVTGVLQGTTNTHVNIGTGASEISILTNQYAK